jgi:flagellar biosynthesis regulator FlaF
MPIKGIKMGKSSKAVEHKEFGSVMENMAKAYEKGAGDLIEDIKKKQAINKILDYFEEEKHKYSEEEKSKILDKIYDGEITSKSEIPKPKKSSMSTKKTVEPLSGQTAKAKKLMDEVSDLMKEVKNFKIEKYKPTKEVKKMMKTMKKVEPLAGQTSKAKKLMEDVAKLMWEVDQFKIEKHKPSKEVKKMTKKLAKPKRITKAQLERDMIARVNEPVNKKKRELRSSINSIPIFVKMMSDSLEAIKKISKDAFDSSSEVKQHYRDLRDKFIKGKEQADELLTTLESLVKDAVKEEWETTEELNKLLGSADIPKYKKEFKAIKDFKFKKLPELKVYEKDIKY